MSAPRAIPVIGRLAWTRLLRGRMVIVIAVLLALPPLLALITFGVGDAHERWDAVITLTLRSLVVLAPAVALASAVGEEIDGKTITYLWSRPLPRWTLIAGKLGAIAPPLALASMVSVGLAYLICHVVGTPVDGGLGGAMLAAALGVLTTATFAVGVGALFPKYPLAVVLGYVLVGENILSSVSSVQEASAIYHAQVLAGVSHGESTVGAVIGMIVLGAVWTGIALWRVGRAEYGDAPG